MTSPSGAHRWPDSGSLFLKARMAGSMADMIAKHGGIVLAAPHYAEIPLDESPKSRPLPSN